MQKIYLLILLPILLFSNDLELKKIAKSKTWLALLHYDINSQSSSIINSDFFLSNSGKTNPLAELKATIKAYNSNDKKAICHFQARYYWLSKKLDLKEFEVKTKDCLAFKVWPFIQDIHSISIVFVSGYLGNPASSFGHSLIKLNKANGEDLLSSTLSYGALLPKHYNMLEYIYNGLSGGYEASYSDEYFYMDTMVYSNQEFRQMWEYQLKLNKEQQTLFLLHLWELRGVRFKYYFFNRNCGYKVAELLDIVEQKPIRSNANIWYAPIETFKRVTKYNLVQNIRYYPSQQQKIYALYYKLSNKEQEFVKRFFKSGVDFSTLKQNSKIRVLDFLLEFFTYKISSLKKGSQDYIKALQTKANLIRLRVKLPASKEDSNLIPPKKPITSYNYPTRVGLLFTKRDKKNKLEIRYAPYANEAVGYNIYNGDILKILDTTISIDSNSIKLEALDILKIRRLNSNLLPFDIENPLSWQIDLGLQRTKDNKFDYYFLLGAGYTWQINNNLKYYFMVNFSLHSKYQNLRVEPTLGLFFSYKKIKIDTQISLENSYKTYNFTPKFTLKANYNLDSSKALYIEFFKSKKQKSIQVGIKWYY